MLQRRGVAAWLRAWSTTSPVSSLAPPGAVPSGGGEVVGVLASMALACLRAG